MSNSKNKIVAFIEIVTVISSTAQVINKLKEYKMSWIDGVVTGKVKIY